MVIPVYNGLDLLPGAVRSALDQDVPPLEVVVVDDGSPAGTASGALLAAGIALDGPVPVRVERQANGGPSRARNRGIALARGAWIAFLDGDDTWEPDKLRWQCQAVQEHPEAVLVSTNWRRPRYPRPAGPVPPARLERDAVRRVASLNRFQTSTVLARRDVLQAAGLFEPATDGQEDWDMWLRVVARGPWVHIPFPLVCYRDSPGGVSKNTLRAYRASRQRLEAYHAGAGDPLVAPAVTRRLLTWHNLRFAFAFHRLRQPANRRECLRAAWRPGTRLLCVDVVVRELVPYLVGRRLARRRGAPAGRADGA